MFKIIFTTFLLCLLAAFTANAQVTADDILGEWMSEEKDSRIEIYKNGKAYFGRLLWAEDLYETDGKTPRKDVRNRDTELKVRSLQNVDILTGFIFEDDVWDDGSMYDPKSGKTYSCIMKLKNQLLEVRSYIGFPLFGKSTYWKKAIKEQL